MHYKMIEFFVLNENLRLVEEPLSLYNMTLGGFEALIRSLSDVIKNKYLLNGI